MSGHMGSTCVYILENAVHSFFLNHSHEWGGTCMNVIFCPHGRTITSAWRCFPSTSSYCVTKKWVASSDTKTCLFKHSIYYSHSSSVQLPWKQQAHGTAWPSNSFWRLADASQPSLKMPGKQCSSACPWPFNRGMRSPSKTQCPPNELPLQPLTLFFNIYAKK